MTIERKVAVITGGSKGIGRAVALAFASNGIAVAIAARSQHDLDTVAGEITELGGTALPIACDVTDEEQVASLVAEATGKLGTVSILVNNAGVAASHKMLGHPDALWDRTIELNLTSVFKVTRAFLPGMVEMGWGRIINMASIASKAGSSYMAAYTASKHGVLGLTRALAMELVPNSITVNAICPGYVDTPMTDGTIANITRFTGRTEEQARAILLATTPQKRLIDPEEVAHVALMLTSDNARGITGQAINVDGGALMF